MPWPEFFVLFFAPALTVACWHRACDLLDVLIPVGLSAAVAPMILQPFSKGSPSE